MPESVPDNGSTKTVKLLPLQGTIEGRGRGENRGNTLQDRRKQRAAAADNLMTMTENARIEANIESMLEAKGIPQNMVTISDNGVEVLVGSSGITDSQESVPGIFPEPALRNN